MEDQDLSLLLDDPKDPDFDIYAFEKSETETSDSDIDGFVLVELYRKKMFVAQRHGRIKKLYAQLITQKMTLIQVLLVRRPRQMTKIMSQIQIQREVR